MTHQQILDYCLTKSGAYIDHPFGPESTIVKVKAPTQGAGRIFTQVFTLRDKPKATFYCDRMTGEFYRDIYPGAVVRGWHCPPIQQPYFNTVDLDGRVPDEEILNMIDHSYATVTAKLPKQAQRELKNSVDVSGDGEIV